MGLRGFAKEKKTRSGTHENGWLDQEGECAQGLRMAPDEVSQGSPFYCMLTKISDKKQTREGVRSAETADFNEVWKILE